MESYPYGVQALFDNIIPVTAVVLLVAILFFVIYYFIYRFYINKKILNGDRTAHSKIVSPAIIVITVGVILCIAAYFVTQYKLQIIGVTAGDSYSAGASNLQILLENTRRSSAEKIAKNYSFTAGKAHNDTKTYDLNLTLETDIELGKNDRLTFRIGDSKSELKMNNDRSYSCTVQASLLKDVHQGILTLESDGDRISEILSDEQIHFSESSDYVDAVNELQSDSFPYIDCSEDNTNINEKDDGTTDISTDITVIAYPANNNSNDTFTEMKLVFEQGGKILSETDLMASSDVRKNGNEYTYTFKGNVKNDIEKYCYVLAKDKGGYSYKLYCDLTDGIFTNTPENTIY